MDNLINGDDVMQIASSPVAKEIIKCISNKNLMLYSETMSLLVI